MPKHVWLLQIDHKEGATNTLHRTRRDVDKEIRDWVKSNWAQEVDRPLPGRLTKADLEEYFNQANEFRLVERLDLPEGM